MDKDLRIQALAYLVTMLRVSDEVAFERRGRNPATGALNFAITFTVPREVATSDGHQRVITDGENLLAPDIVAAQKLDKAFADCVSRISPIDYLRSVATTILDGEPKRAQDARSRKARHWETKVKRDKEIRDAGIEVPAAENRPRSRPKKKPVECSGCGKYFALRKIKAGMCAGCIAAVADEFGDGAIDKLFDLG